jgi:alpha-1,6-mannosyltransferase
VLGYLGGYIDEEGLASGRGFNVVWLLEGLAGPVPGAAQVYIAAAAAIMIALALAVGFRRDRSAEAAVASLCWLLAAFLTLASPHYPWYFLALVPLLAIHASAAAWVLTLGGPLLYESAAGTSWPAYDLRIAAFTLATVAALAFDAWSLRRTVPGKPLDRTVGETS